MMFYDVGVSGINFTGCIVFEVDLSQGNISVHVSLVPSEPEICGVLEKFKLMHLLGNDHFIPCI